MLQMRAAQSENHEARMRLIRSLALNAGPPLPGHTTETHEALAMNWLLSALQVEYMLEPLGRVIKGTKRNIPTRYAATRASIMIVIQRIFF